MSADELDRKALDSAVRSVKPNAYGARPIPKIVHAVQAAGFRRTAPVEVVTTVERPEVVVLCGSTRFKDAFWSEGSRLAREGLVVLGVADLDPRPEARDVNVPIDVETKERLDTAHMHMIRMADRVHVIDVGGYIGESTQREIAYARSQGKRVTYLFRPDREEG